MNREEVEALLAACERDRIGPHPDNETLADLCRLWLAVEDAPKAVVECNDAKGAWLIAADDAPLSGGQRVRIVPEAGEGVAGG